MKILGYSERGILNSLLYEIRYHDNSDALFGQLIDQAMFPFTDDKPPAGELTIYVEPSFSRYFGDADAVFLIESGKEKCVIFIEAKVGEDQRLCKKFGKFKDGPSEKNRGHSSFIFMQLYHKQLIMKNSAESLKKGIITHEWSRCKERSLGKHKVVHAVTEKIKACGGNAFYLMLVPDNDQQAAYFFGEVLRKQNACIKSKLPEWDSTYFGYLTWETVEGFCNDNNLKNTRTVFKHNGEQIYKRHKK